MPRLILRTGIDMLDISRLEEIDPKIRDRFMRRVYLPAELESADGSFASLAGIFCVKEAVSKALGCGIGEISWQDIETVADSKGAPRVVLHGNAAHLADMLGLTTWAVSITHTRQTAAAAVTAVGMDTE
ncbi:holo-ACP synthase [Leptolinea tardivitalis]|uniref:Holo-[acyl-carrier-protein] synthase n=1 Tax=Leptolinea tardivitalis TaxID=229920 RepID=A0A0P6X0Y7_9CHLR|nr:holo-ACP synthase [Leptolinea tardivitalis]KPL72955.1 ACP synthase [Leptolinea tardivitalis]GAP20646.1 holo-[acyl-carrier-protein] synthase [Leptolinea tardivitalis]